MAWIEKTKGHLKLFGYDVYNVTGNYYRETSTVPRTMAGKRIVIKLVEFLQQLSNFSNMQDEEIQEQLFIWDPEIGGASDRQSTLIAQSYRGPVLLDPDMKTQDIEKRMMKSAVEVSEAMRASDLFEMYGELLALYGDLYLDAIVTGKQIGRAHV